MKQENNVNSKQTSGSLSGSELITYFVNAVTNIVTSETAKVAASESEQRVLSGMQQLAGSDAYTSAGDLTSINVNKLAKDSLNSHLEKVQSEQINQFVAQQLAQLQTEVTKKYTGKKIRIQRIPNYSNQFEAVYVDNGQPRISPYNGQHINGKIHEAVLEQNILLITPTFLSSKLTPNRIFYRVHVLDLETIQPQVTVDL